MLLLKLTHGYNAIFRVKLKLRESCVPSEETQGRGMPHVERLLQFTA